VWKGMKLGISTYCLYQKMKSKEMNVIDVIQWISDEGAEHVEITPVGFDLENDSELVDSILRKVRELNIEISNYAVGGNFITQTKEAYEHEIQRIKKHVDIAHRLGVRFMRHDVAARPIAETMESNFISDLPKLADACRRIADYAAIFGITTSVENHGYYIQSSGRIRRLIDLVNRPNYKTTLDIGNFMCVDEEPISACRDNLPYASIVHIKDFYIRPAHRDPGEGWFKTANGNYLRGAIIGQGDIDVWEVLRQVKQSGYDGYISMEFEGMEDCLSGTRIGLKNIKRIWSEL